MRAEKCVSDRSTVVERVSSTRTTGSGWSFQIRCLLLGSNNLADPTAFLTLSSGTHDGATRNLSAKVRSCVGYERAQSVLRGQADMVSFRRNLAAEPTGRIRQAPSCDLET
jgi:hypothetical protein